MPYNQHVPVEAWPLGSASQRGAAGLAGPGMWWGVTSCFCCPQFQSSLQARFSSRSGPSSQVWTEQPGTPSVELTFTAQRPQAATRRGLGRALTGSVEGTETSWWPHQGAWGHRAEEQGAKYGWRAWRGTTNKERKNRSFAKLVFLWIFYFFIIHHLSSNPINHLVPEI